MVNLVKRGSTYWMSPIDDTRSQRVNELLLLSQFHTTKYVCKQNVYQPNFCEKTYNHKQCRKIEVVFHIQILGADVLIAGTSRPCCNLGKGRSFSFLVAAWLHPYQKSSLNLLILTNDVTGRCIGLNLLDL